MILISKVSDVDLCDKTNIYLYKNYSVVMGKRVQTENLRGLKRSTLVGFFLFFLGGPGNHLFETGINDIAHGLI